MNLSFSVGDDENNVRKNRELFFGAFNIPPSQIAYQKQIHSNNVRIITAPGMYEETDALITNVRNLSLCVTIADCMPIFLFDKKQNVVAAVHSGWRGCANGIVQNTLTALEKEFLTQGENLICYVGPAADKCCYEVGEEVAKQFPGKYFQQKNENKFLLDMKSFVRDVLLSFRVQESNIEVAPFCTIHQSDVFHSYRRDGKFSGRMMGVIGMDEK